MTQTLELAITGMSCAGCAHTVTQALRKTPGVVGAGVNFATRSATVVYNPRLTGRERLAAAVTAAGYGVALERSREELERAEAASLRRRLWVAVGFSLPVVVLAARETASEESRILYEKTLSNIQEVKAREGLVVAVANQGDQGVRSLADYTIEIPPSLELLLPILEIVPLQLLAYHIAVRRGCDVDQPRNLAKSVTVE